MPGFYGQLEIFGCWNCQWNDACPQTQKAKGKYSPKSLK